LWVLKLTDKNSGNASLVDKQGAKWLPDVGYNADSLVQRDLKIAPPAHVETSLFDVLLPETGAVAVAEPPSSLYTATETGQTDHATIAAKGIATMSFYDFFLKRLEAVTAGGPVDLEKLLTILDINKTQCNDWLKLGISEGKIQKINKPVRYKAVKVIQQALNL
jgi:hypothetical protein